MTRPTIAYGSRGGFVEELQTALALPADGNFGQQTQRGVEMFQTAQSLESDGIVGPATWAVLESAHQLSPYPPPLLEPLDDAVTDQILAIADDSAISGYAW